MSESSEPQKIEHIENLKARIEYLEKINRWYNYALEMFSSLNEIFSGKEQSRDVQTVLEKTKEYILKIFQFEVVSFYLIDEASSEFKFFNCAPDSESVFVQKKIDELIDAGEFSWAINQNKSAIFPFPKLHRTLVLHVISSKNRLRGMFVGVLSTESREIIDGSLRLLSIILHNTGYALESRELYSILADQNKLLEKKIEERNEQLEYRHSHDNLTDLPNRILFLDRLEQALLRAERGSQYVGILMVDLDMFKVVNDTLGHILGDELLKQVALRFKNSIRGYDSLLQLDETLSEMTISRLGSDEFGFLLTDIHHLDDVLHVVHRILKVISEPFDILDNRVFITSSVGISIFPDDGSDPRIMLQHADVAMSHAKKKGKNTYQFFSKEMNKNAFEYFKIGSDLHQAIEKEEFILHYQPLIDLKTQRMFGMEALIRWVRNDTIVFPDHFIPIAEEMSLITQIGDWVITRSCKTLKNFKKLGFPDLKIAVNLAAQQFKSPNLAEKIMKEIQIHDLEPHQLELEITERAIMEDAGQTSKILEDLHEAGFSISIDDFGTGYSSLNYLKKFKVDVIKIDRSFISDLLNNADDQAIVRAIVALAHTLGLSLVAEGIEKPEQAEFLKELGCEYAQGYYFSKPLDEFNLIKYMKESDWQCK